MPKKKPQRKSKQPAGPDLLALLAGAAASELTARLTDPYVIMLETIIEQRKPTTTADPLLKLRVLHERAIRKPEALHPLDAHTATLLAGEARLPAPPWAIAILKEIQEAKIQNQKVDLNQRLGFTAQGSGRTSEAERRARENIADESRKRIWGLSLLNYSIKKACWMEAGRMQQLAGWNTTDYDLEPDLGSRSKDLDVRARQLHDKRLAFAELLRKDYYKWRTPIETDADSEVRRYFLQCLADTREQFLAQFPTD